MFLLDLHGNLNKKEITPDGRKDENVFDIEQGVAIGLFVKDSPKNHDVSSALVRHANCWGARVEKNDWLFSHHAANADWANVTCHGKLYLFKNLGSANIEDYEDWSSVLTIFPENSVGIVTARDALTVHWSVQDVSDVVSDIAQSDTEEVRRKYKLGKDVHDWKVEWAQEDLRRAGPSGKDIVSILYRPFDIRFTYYTGQSRGFLCRPRAEVMEHMLAGENVGFITTRQTKDEWGALATSTNHCAQSVLGLRHQLALSSLSLSRCWQG